MDGSPYCTVLSKALGLGSVPLDVRVRQRLPQQSGRTMRRRRRELIVYLWPRPVASSCSVRRRTSQGAPASLPTRTLFRCIQLQEEAVSCAAWETVDSAAD